MFGLVPFPGSRLDAVSVDIRGEGYVGDGENVGWFPLPLPEDLEDVEFPLVRHFVERVRGDDRAETAESGFG